AAQFRRWKGTSETEIVCATSNGASVGIVHLLGGPKLQTHRLAERTPALSHSHVAQQRHGPGDGGSNGTGLFLDTAEIYNPATGTWRYTLHSMNVARYAHTAVRLLDGRVLLAGAGT